MQEGDKKVRITLAVNDNKIRCVFPSEVTLGLYDSRNVVFKKSVNLQGINEKLFIIFFSLYMYMICACKLKIYKMHFLI